MGTGTFPSFIEVKGQFETKETGEDNFFYQYFQTKQKSVCVGDNTWKIFPEACKTGFIQQDFNVQEIHSDNKVIPYLFPYLYLNNDRDYYVNFT